MKAWELNVSRDKVRGAFHVIKFGTNNDVDGSLETIWDAGGLYTYLTTATTVTVTSTDSDDSASGSGARTITVEGLDANYDLVSETLTVGGSAGTTEFLRVFRAFVATSGSTGSNEGTISVTLGNNSCTNSYCRFPNCKWINPNIYNFYILCLQDTLDISLIGMYRLQKQMVMCFY